MFSDILLKYYWVGLSEIIGVRFLAWLILKKGLQFVKLVSFVQEGKYSTIYFALKETWKNSAELPNSKIYAS